MVDFNIGEPRNPFENQIDRDAMFEFSSEMTQNQFKEGFVNLGSGNNNFFNFEATSKTFLINAQGGDDRIVLQNGWTLDTVHGGSGNDTIDTDGGEDIVSGGSGDDLIFGGAGNDVISGGSGDDILNGDNGAVASFYHGIDRISGGTGNDTITGGGMADILTGNSGNDIFRYEVKVDSLVGQADTITDFARGKDKIDLSAINPVGELNNTNIFVFATAPSTAAGTVWTQGNSVFVNIDGGVADMEIKTTGVTLGSTDFIY